jgi:hypothetical protein
MLTNPTSQNNSQSIRDNLSYINDLIIEATNMGMYNIFVDGTYMGSSEATLIRSYGYNVTETNNDFGTYKTYIITWEGLQEEDGLLMTELFSFLTNENGDYLCKELV